ncbi:MAG: hypothetical protein GVY12_16035 [Bacteroidetes bacterium]|jgi:hypothetical protein|nr:hypothetical protein [Bacteroidota bacterium]
MTIKRIAVSYAETVTTGDYCNARPSVTYEAELEPDDRPDQVQRGLQRQARITVREEVNQALEASGKRAKYHDGPTYQILESRRDFEERVIIIVPNQMRDERLEDYTGWYGPDITNIRYEHAKRVAKGRAKYREGVEIIDCSDGDLSKLPELTEKPDPQMPF